MKLVIYMLMVLASMVFAAPILAVLDQFHNPLMWALLMVVFLFGCHILFDIYPPAKDEEADAHA